MTSSHYVHGTSPDEQRRLSRLNQLLNDSSLAALELEAGDRVLDVGSGLGQLSRRMAQVVGPRGRVVGIEQNRDQIAEAERQATLQGEAGRVEFRQGDAQRLPLADGEWGSFDVAHARFVLEHVPDPERVVAGMLRAVRPGGRLVLEDDDHEILRPWPELPELGEVWKAYMRSYERHGNDPIIGRRLVELLRRAGAEPRRSQWLTFGACSGHPDFPLYVANLGAILDMARKDIVETGDVEDSDVEAVLAALRVWGARPDAVLWYARSWAEGVSPG
jgi:ubiquinone/menaquinone biosynthesis C-methylase UbiE